MNDSEDTLERARVEDREQVEALRGMVRPKPSPIAFAVGARTQLAGTVNL